MDYIELNKRNTELLINRHISDKTLHNKLKKNRYAIQINMLAKYISKDGLLLDIGIRDGVFLEFLKDQGYINLCGIDIYPRSIEIAKDKGLDCEVADVQTLNLKRRFDTVIMSHVLEHCPDPIKVLKNVHKHMNADGILFIEVPIEQGPPKPTEKDAHYFNFHSFDTAASMLSGGWFILEKVVSEKRIKVVVRKVDCD